MNSRFLRSDNIAAEYLPLANQLVILPAADGTIQQGTYEEMKEAGLINIAAYGNVESAYHHKDMPAENLDEKLSKVASEVEARDLARQTGDMAVYRYYFKSIGLAKFLIFVFFVLVYVFSSSFSRKGSVRILLTKAYSMQRPGSSGGWTSMVVRLHYIPAYISCFQFCIQLVMAVMHGMHHTLVFMKMILKRIGQYA